jgi:hypothetical protein
MYIKTALGLRCSQIIAQVSKKRELRAVGASSSLYNFWFYIDHMCSNENPRTNVDTSAVLGQITSADGDGGDNGSYDNGGGGRRPPRETRSESSSDGDGDEDEDDGKTLGRQIANLGLADEGTTPEIQNAGKYRAMVRGVLKGNSVQKREAKLYPEYKVRRNGAKFFHRGKVSSLVP